MRLTDLALAAFAVLSSATILQNGQVRVTDYPDTTVAPILNGRHSEWKTYAPSAPELSYKGRWDHQYISWWSAPGLKFGFQAEQVAISFGNYTSPGVLIAYRLDGQDWMLTNVTANSTHLLITPSTTGYNLTTPAGAVQTFELRVTNYAYGVQIKNVHVTGRKAKLVKIPDYPRHMEIIGDSLSSGYSDTFEGLSSYAWGLAYGFGQTEFGITAFPGICVTDVPCFGNPRGQSFQWTRTVDTSSRAVEIYGDNPPVWDFAAHSKPEIVVINIGTNDNNTANNVTSAQYVPAYISLIEQVHNTWPDAQIIVQSLWSGWYQTGNSWQQATGFYNEIQTVVKHFNNDYNTTGIMQHNDNDPAYHPTDVGHIKIASHLMEYIRILFGWDLLATGPEVQHQTLYWNDEVAY